MAFPDKNFSSYLDQNLNKYNQLFVESGNLKLNDAGRLFADNISSDMFI